MELEQGWLLIETDKAEAGRTEQEETLTAVEQRRAKKPW